MVESYVAEGAKVAIADISLAGAQKTAAPYGDKAFAVAIDVTKLASIEAAIDAVVARWAASTSSSTTPACSTWARSSKCPKRAGTRSSRSIRRACSSRSRRSPNG